MSQFAREDRRGAIDFVSDGDITFEADRDQDGAGDLVFRTGGVERARIDHAGVGTGWGNVLGGSVTYVHAPTGTVGTDQSVLADAVSDTPDGGTIVLANGGDTPYAIDTALVVAAKNLSIEGAGPVGVVGYDGGTPLTSPFLTGPVILQTAAGENGIEITAKAAVVNLKNLGVLFDNPGTVAFADTGHGIVAQTTTVFDTGHDLGLVDSLWENVWVFGHDGDHYARVIVNGLCNTFINMRSQGGGIVRYVQDSDRIVSGNTVDTHTFGQMFCAGTAHAFSFAPIAGSGASGALNLFTFIRPQVNMVDYSAKTAFGSPAKTTTSQYMWQASEDGTHEALSVTVISPDLEADDSVAHPVNFGSAASGNTVLNGGAIDTGGAVTLLGQVLTGISASGGIAFGPSALIALTTGSKNVAVGRNALTALTTGSNNTAVGRDTLKAAVSAINCTAVGQGALAAATGNANTAVGSSALNAVTTGGNNVAVGDSALLVSTGSSCTAVGSAALASSTTALNNTAIGKEAFTSDTTGHDNTAIGYQAGKTETAANATTTASNQTIIGSQAGLASTTQVNEIVTIGYRAKAGGAGAIALGSQAQATGAASVAIGQLVTTSIANQIALGTSSHHVLLKTVAAPADTALAASQFTLWLTDTPSGAKLNIKAKDSAGTVVTGTLTLA